MFVELYIQILLDNNQVYVLMVYKILSMFCIHQHSKVPLGKPIEEVYEGVHDGPVLGSGISGIVRLVKHRATQVAYAVKCLDLALIDSEEGLKQLKEEIYIMCQLVSCCCCCRCTIDILNVYSNKSCIQ